MKIPFNITWQLITPPQAREWLKKNPKNRKLRKFTVQSLARDIKAGAWAPTHQGIAFGADGNLIDGQHRLAAIVLANLPIWSLVFTGLPVRASGVNADTMDVVDRGNPRSVADILKLRHNITASPNLVAAVCVIIARIVAGKSRASRLTVPQTLAVLDRYTNSIGYVATFDSPKHQALRKAAVFGAVAFAHAVEPKAVEDFFEKLLSGAGLPAGSAGLTLRNFIMGGMTRADGGGSAERLYLAEAVLHAIYSEVIDEPMPKIPKREDCIGAEWFRQQQPKNVAAVNEIVMRLDDKPVEAAPSSSKSKTQHTPRGLGTKEIEDRSQKFREALKRVQAREIA